MAPRERDRDCEVLEPPAARVPALDRVAAAQVFITLILQLYNSTTLQLYKSHNSRNSQLDNSATPQRYKSTTLSMSH